VLNLSPVNLLNVLLHTCEFPRRPTYTADRDLNAARNIDRWFEDIFVPERSETGSYVIVV
jgi:hypothetical protein